MIITNYILSMELAILILFCTYSDIRTRIIPNKLTISLALTGLLTRAFFLKYVGLLEGVEGMLLAFALLIVPYIIGGLGAGDVKMLMAIGAIGGISFVVHVLIWTAIAGGVMSAFILISDKRIKSGLRNIKNYMLSTFLLQKLVVMDQPEEAKKYFPYGVAICLGTIVALVNNIRLTGSFFNV